MNMPDNYKTPAGTGSSEILEKRSKFIGSVSPILCEEDAKDVIARLKSKFHDARHNCWCYILRGGTERYSDDGEPQGTAGLPMLEVFRRSGITDVCCVVTRYFGGILLGPGGLLRAYSETAKLALADAGVSDMCLYDCMEIVCPYNLQGKVKAELESSHGIVDGIEYGQSVVFTVLFPVGYADIFNLRLADISSGTVVGRVTGQRFAHYKTPKLC